MILKFGESNKMEPMYQYQSFYRETFIEEQALDLRIHSRKYEKEEDDHEPLDLSDTSTSPEVDMLYAAGPELTETQDDGELVIVEAGVRDVPVNELHMEVDGDSGLLLQLHDMTDAEPPQKPARTSTGRATVKHYPSADRLIKSSRLMCFLCDQKAKNGKTLETHIQKSHTVITAQGKFLCCTECRFKCEFVDELKDHFNADHGDSRAGAESRSRAYYPCTHCSRMYRKQSLLDAHMRLVNQKDNWRKIKKAS